MIACVSNGFIMSTNPLCETAATENEAMKDLKSSLRYQSISVSTLMRPGGFCYSWCNIYLKADTETDQSL